MKSEIKRIKKRREVDSQGRIHVSNELEDLVPDMDSFVDQDSLETTDSILRSTHPEVVREHFITFEKWYPILRAFGDPDELSLEEMISRVTPLSVAKLVELMMSAKSEKVQAQCAKDLAFIGGLKPVEKSQSVNVNVMTRRESSALLASKLEKYGIQVVDDDGSGENYQDGMLNESDFTGEIIYDDGKGK